MEQPAQGEWLGRGIQARARLDAVQHFELRCFVLQRVQAPPLMIRKPRSEILSRG
jgi:hypothetical protein